jgi:hypothetical protein
MREECSYGEQEENWCFCVVCNGLRCGSFAPASSEHEGKHSPGERQVSLTFAGSGYNTVVDPNQDGFPVQLTRARMKGSFGAADLAITTEWIIYPRECPSAYDLPLAIVNSALVITVPDQSQVYGFSQVGWMCVNTTTGVSVGEMSGIYSGGTGRHVNATGDRGVNFEAATLDPAIGFLSIRGSGKPTISLK